MTLHIFTGAWVVFGVVCAGGGWKEVIGWIFLFANFVPYVKVNLIHLRKRLIYPPPLGNGPIAPPLGEKPTLYNSRPRFKL